MVAHNAKMSMRPNAPPGRFRPRRQTAAALAFAAINLALAAIVTVELRTSDTLMGAPAVTMTQPTPAAPSSDDFFLPPLSAYAAVTERPLFARNRRPLAPQAAAATVADAKSFVLVGVTVSGKERMAVIRRGAPPTIARLTEGQEIDGWTVRHIGDDRVVLRNHATEATIPLYKDAAGPDKQ